MDKSERKKPIPAIYQPVPAVLSYIGNKIVHDERRSTFMQKIIDFKYSDQSVQASRARPGRMLNCSEEAGWRSMLLQTFEQPTSVEEYGTLASPDALLVFVLEGNYELESFGARSWERAAYRPGMGGFTAPFTTNRLRWTSNTSTTARVLRLYLPQQYFAETYEAHRPAGGRSKFAVPDALSLSDSTLFFVAEAALAAVKQGEVDFYADACARFLATHLICKFENWSHDFIEKIGATDLPDRRLKRVLEFMEHDFACGLTVNQLAREAGISPFHFSRIFKREVGVTPHQHLRRLRLRHARDLLAETDVPILQIAEACGYVHAGHFAAAFQQAFGCVPSAPRKLTQGL